MRRPWILTFSWEKMYIGKQQIYLLEFLLQVQLLLSEAELLMQIGLLESLKSISSNPTIVGLRNFSSLRNVFFKPFDSLTQERSISLIASSPAYFDTSRENVIHSQNHLRPWTSVTMALLKNRHSLSQPMQITKLRRHSFVYSENMQRKFLACRFGLRN